METSRRGFLAGSALMAAAPGQAPPSSLRLAVVNVRTCFDKEKYARMAEAFEDLVKFRDQLNKDLQELQKKILGLSEQINAVSTKGELYVDKLRQRTHAEVDLKLLQEVARRRLREKLGDLEARVYADVRRVVARLSRLQNLDVVLRVDEPRFQEDDLEGSALQAIASREVLFHRDELDLTAKVLEGLNADWAKAWTCASCKRKLADDKCPDCGVKRP